MVVLLIFLKGLVPIASQYWTNLLQISMLSLSMCLRPCWDGRYSCILPIYRPFPTVHIFSGLRIPFHSIRNLRVSREWPRFLKIKRLSIPLTLSILHFSGCLTELIKLKLFGKKIQMSGRFDFACVYACRVVIGRFVVMARIAR